MPSGVGWAWLALLVLAVVWATKSRPQFFVVTMPAWLPALFFTVVMVATVGGKDVRAATMARPNWRMLGAAWAWVDHNLHGARIAYVGNNVPYFLCGQRLENHVFYVPARRPADGCYHDFAMLPQTRAIGPPDMSGPACDRYVMDPQEWLENLMALRVDYVFVSALLPGLLPSYRHDAEGFTIEREWLDVLCQASPKARPIAQLQVFAPGSVRLYKLDLSVPMPPGLHLRRVVQDETDALARLRQDRTPPGQPIRDYPLARRVIDEEGLRPLIDLPTRR
ncbi:MAG TPA: hypothetical protein VMV94_18775 [Phycisphaerae bacterium]|nr:hypothetical protein [Phycisphaerae bacterium]